MIGDAGRQLTLRLNAYGIFYIMGMDNPLRESNNNEKKKTKKKVVLVMMALLLLCVNKHNIIRRMKENFSIKYRKTYSGIDKNW